MDKEEMRGNIIKRSNCAIFWVGNKTSKDMHA